MMETAEAEEAGVVWVVTGRFLFDDEDSIHELPGPGRDDALAEWQRKMREDDPENENALTVTGVEGPYQKLPEGSPPAVTFTPGQIDSLWSLYAGLGDGPAADALEGVLRTYGVLGDEPETEDSVSAQYRLEAGGDVTEFETAGDACDQLVQAIMNEISNGSLGECRGPDGELLQLEITVRALNQVESPETSGLWKCPSCGQAREFIGVDGRASVSQTVRVDDDGDADYDGTWAGDVGEYTRIECSSCHQPVWTEYLP